MSQYPRFKSSKLKSPGPWLLINYQLPELVSKQNANEFFFKQLNTVLNKKILFKHYTQNCLERWTVYFGSSILQE